MFYTIAVILFLLWLMGVIGFYSMGWFVHILLVAAVIVLLIRFLQGRNLLK
jgi:hypothetical protein